MRCSFCAITMGFLASLSSLPQGINANEIRVYNQPPLTAAQADANIQAPAVPQRGDSVPEPTSMFIETDRAYHISGRRAGQLAWVQGFLDGRQVRLYYDDQGKLVRERRMGSATR